MKKVSKREIKTVRDTCDVFGGRVHALVRQYVDENAEADKEWPGLVLLGMQFALLRQAALVALCARDTCAAKHTERAFRNMAREAYADMAEAEDE